MKEKDEQLKIKDEVCRKQTEQLTEQLKELKEKEHLVNCLKIHKSIFDNAVKNTEKKEEVYIVTSRQYAQEYLFKIGTSCDSHKRLFSPEYFHDPGKSTVYCSCCMLLRWKICRKNNKTTS